ncbi:MAG: hypothetical protein FJW92_03255 [Actinobacteria bacterium]|nr:hypothetical protein [Actinomycetota bacterium]
MPGSHDAGTWNSIGWLDRACADSGILVDLGNIAAFGSPAWNTIAKWAYAQYDEPYYQARGGARYFDLRAIRDKSPGDDGYFLRTCHSTIGAGLGSFFNPNNPGSLAAYAAEHPQEVLVVDWQKVIDEQAGTPLSADGLKQFREYITTKVCPNRALTNDDVYSGKVDPGLTREADIPRLSISAIAKTGHNIINLMDSRADRALYQSLDKSKKSSWCIWDRGVTLASYWDTNADATPWKNGFAYGRARVALFADEAA